MATEQTPNSNDGWIAEADIAESLGVKRDDIKAQRPAHATGEITFRGNTIYWLKNAALRVANSLGLSGEPLEKNAAPTPTPSTPAGELLTVVSVPGPKGFHFGNPNLIKAKRPSGEVVVVRVVNSKKYLPMGRNGKPMTLRAKPAEEGTWWILIGREPRFIGAW